jgi:DNA-nicking Smr family endonuclease
MSKPRKAAPTPDEVELFRASVSDVTPLPGPGRVRHKLPLPQPVPAQRLRDDRQTLQDSLSHKHPWDAGAESGEELCYLRSGVGADVLRKLRRGHWVIQDELDLHGLRVDDAHALLVVFLNQCLRRGLRCVRIVHGKGLGSRNREPVLKGKLRAWLAPRDEVLAFCQAPPAEGGSGALLVLLKGR